MCRVRNGRLIGLDMVYWIKVVVVGVSLPWDVSWDAPRWKRRVSVRGIRTVSVVNVWGHRVWESVCVWWFNWVGSGYGGCGVYICVSSPGFSLILGCSECVHLVPYLMQS